jgi:hypothetical protein
VGGEGCAEHGCRGVGPGRAGGACGAAGCTETAPAAALAAACPTPAFPPAFLRRGHKERDHADEAFNARFQNLEDVVGQLMSVAQDQNGCRYLQVRRG